jgi:hypothetical protein
MCLSVFQESGTRDLLSLPCAAAAAAVLQVQEFTYNVRDYPDHCENCGTAETKEAKLKKCSRCKMVAYCNRDCQKNHWKEHKEDCNKWYDRNRLE